MAPAQIWSPQPQGILSRLCASACQETVGVLRCTNVGKNWVSQCREVADILANTPPSSESMSAAVGEVEWTGGWSI